MRTLALAVLLAGLSSTAQADSTDITFAGRFSTLGFGIESSTGYWETVQLRAQLNAGTFEWSGKNKNRPYDREPELLTAGLFADFYPIDLLRISVGGYVNKSRIKLDRSGAGDYQVGDNRYRAGGDYALDGEVEFRSVAPYFGIGFGNPITSKSALSFSVDVGVMGAGKPEATLNSRGTVTPINEDGTPIGPTVDAATDPGFRADLRREQDRAADDADSYQFYPVIGVSLAYRF